MSEIWKSVPGYEGLYEVSSAGRARRLPRFQSIANRWGTLSHRLLSGQILVPFETGNRGYLTVSLWRDGQVRRGRLNAIVCEAFHGPPPHDKPCALHINGDRYDNRAENIRWGDHLDNAADREAHGMTAKGERQHSSKLTVSLVRSIRARAAAGEHIAPIARELGVHPSSIHAVVKRQSWRHIE